MCEVNIDACSTVDGSAPCEHGSSCLDGDVGLEYACLCTAGYTGKRGNCENMYHLLAASQHPGGV